MGQKIWNMSGEARRQAVAAKAGKMVEVRWSHSRQLEHSSTIEGKVLGVAVDLSGTIDRLIVQPVVLVRDEDGHLWSSTAKVAGQPLVHLSLAQVAELRELDLHGHVTLS